MRNENNSTYFINKKSAVYLLQRLLDIRNYNIFLHTYLRKSYKSLCFTTE